MKTVNLVLCAFFAALTAALSQLVIPVGPVPVNLATFSVLSAGALLGAKRGALSQLVYVLLGAAGIPVFSMFRSGLGMLVGPTGGYIAGYVLAAFVTGFGVSRFGDRLRVLVLSMLAGYVAYTVPGTLWYMFYGSVGFSEALTVCVLPFIPGDALKIAAASLLVPRLRTILKSRGAL